MSKLKSYHAANLKIAQSCSQMIIVAVDNSGAAVTMNVKSDDGTWKEIINTRGVIGYRGIGKTCEGDGKTPVGVFHLSYAFGVKDNPVTAFTYRKIDDTDYWVDDPDSQYYNQFVSVKNVIKDWKSAEHLIDLPEAYAYVIPVDYNLECKKNAGSAIFLHCSCGTSTAGCVAIPEESMAAILQNIEKGCVILIDDEAKISIY